MRTVHDAIMKLIHRICNGYKSIEERFVSAANTRFNGLSVTEKKLSVVLCGFLVGVVCVMLITQAINGNSKRSITVTRITDTKDSYMKKNYKDFNQLIPLGKMKGMVDGEYDSFYVAIDKEASIYINRSIEYSDSAYIKSNRWEKITRQKLDEYAKSLHFLPFQSKKGKALNLRVFYHLLI
jgi:hypothetical protein